MAIKPSNTKSGIGDECNVSQSNHEIFIIPIFSMKKLNSENLSNKPKVPQIAKGKSGVGVERWFYGARI